jgi:undecaprenyl diphosphate synthase
MSNGLPRHVAIIMDGNGRWAKCRQQPRFAGHRAGVENVRALVQHCVKRGIECLTLFAFSSENWRRPPTEVRLLMDLFVHALRDESRKLHENGVRLTVIGDRSAFPKRLQEAITDAETLTRENTRLNMVVAANYGGRWDITEAARALAEEVQAGTLDPGAITPELVASKLSLADLPEPDLFIRSGGDQRISNYLLWQLAYTELYFTECLWPDFDIEQFELALESFQQRQRRFGMTGDQVEATPARLRRGTP